MTALQTAVKRAADNALQVQDACNSSGVVFSFARQMQTICDASTELKKGTDWKNHHPIVFLFTYKIQALNRFEQLGLDGQYKWAERECSRMADTGEADYVGYGESGA